jgi:hypothetical protein
MQNNNMNKEVIKKHCSWCYKAMQSFLQEIPPSPSSSPIKKT